MTEDGTRLFHLPGIQGQDMRLDRNLLKDRAAETLRDHISSGRIPEGTKLTEREVSRLLGISRMPARDALMILEAEGLILSRPDGRYVIELSEKDVRDIHVLRWTLEGLAVRLAAANCLAAGNGGAANCSAGNGSAGDVLLARLDDLEAAAQDGDPSVVTRRDMALHRAIWNLAENPHLLRVLDSVLGAIFVLCDRARVHGPYDVENMLVEHRKLVDLIVEGEGEGAAQAIESHLRNALQASLRALSDRARSDREQGEPPG
jgi:DNA-binding GntR family transcriptional regulator